MSIQKIFCSIIFLLAVLCGSAGAQEAGEEASREELTIPVIVDEQAPKSYLERMVKKLEKFIDTLHKKEQSFIADDHLADLDRFYQNFQTWAHIKIHGSLQNQTAKHIYKPDHFTKLDNKIFLSGAGEVSSNLKYFVSGRFHYDSIYDYSDHYSKSVASDQRAEGELRDTYVDYSLGSWDLRLGNQQIVWGEAVGLFYADVVNAKDLREYILPDFEYIRIPEAGINVEYSKNNFHSQLIFLPDVEVDKTGVTGSEFAFPLPLPNNNTPFTIRDPAQPKDGFENAKAGAKLAYLLGGVDVSAFYLRSWTSLPVMYRTINSGVFQFDPTYKRQNIFGATFAKELNDYVCKGELVYYPNAYFPVIDATDADGIKESGYVDYLIGVDHTYFSRWDVNLQFMQRFMMDHDETFLNEDKLSSGFSVRISRNWLSQKLTTEALAIINFRSPDFLYRPKVSYAINTSWKVAVGADIFAGEPTGLFGFFRNKSRWYTEVTYKF